MRIESNMINKCVKCPAMPELLRQVLPYLLYAYVVYAGLFYVYWLINPFPNELREGAGLHLAKLFAQGVNPFNDDAPVSFYYMYGFVSGLLAAPFYALTGADGFLILRLVSLGSLVATSILIYVAVRRFGADGFPPLLAALLVLQTGWITHELVARPDQLAMLLYTGCALLLVSSARPAATAFAAVLLVLSFYTKQYFIVLGVPLFAGLLYLDWRRAFLFAVATGTWLLFSILLVQFAFPRYFPMTILSFGPTPLSTDHLYTQIEIFVRVYWPLLVIIALGGLLYFRATRRGTTGFGQGRADAMENSQGVQTRIARDYAIFWLVQFAGGFVFLLYLGQNVGAYITYFNQFLLLPLLFMAAAASITLRKKCYFVYLLYAVVGVSLFHFGHHYLHFSRPLTQEETESWDKATAVVSSAGNNIDLRTPLFVEQALNSNLRVFANGLQAHKWLREAYLDLKEKGSALLLLFPAAEGMIADAERYRVEQESLAAKTNDLTVVTDNFGKKSFDDLSRDGFKVVKVLRLRSGSQSWKVRFWRRDGVLPSFFPVR